MTANQRRWLRRSVVLAVFVVVVVVFNHSFQKNAKSAQPPAPPSIPVVTAVAKKGISRHGRPKLSKIGGLLD